MTVNTSSNVRASKTAIFSKNVTTMDRSLVRQNIADGIFEFYAFSLFPRFQRNEADVAELWSRSS